MEVRFLTKQGAALFPLMCRLSKGPAPGRQDSGLWPRLLVSALDPPQTQLLLTTWISFEGVGYFSAGCVIRAGKIVETPGQWFPGWEPLGAGFLRLFPVLSKA